MNRAQTPVPDSNEPARRGTTPFGSAPRWLDRDWLPAATVGLCVLVLLAFLPGPLTPDVGGQFWIARAMRHGARLYVDIVEINPPLWFWMAMPVDALADALGIRSEPVTIVVVGLLVWCAVQASRALLRRTDAPPSPLFYPYMAIVLLIMPMQALEQREHLALIGSVPYLVLAAVRREKASVPAPLAVAAGIGAALGLALKPYFLGVPLLTELWLLASLRRDWRPFRAETLALAASGLTYAAALLIISPEYLTDTIPNLLPVYNAASPPLFGGFDILPWLWIAMLCGLLEWRREIGKGKAPLSVAFLCGAAGFAIAFFVQHRGWLYQGLPTTGCLALALAAARARFGRPVSAIRLFLPALLVWPLAFPLAQTEAAIDPSNDIAPALEGLKPGDSFGLISNMGATTWPSTVGRDLRLGSRYGQYWLLTALDHEPDNPAVLRAGRRAVRETALDYRCLPPKVIIFTRYDRSGQSEWIADDPHRYFMRDPEFRATLGHYRLWRSFGVFDAYRQAAPIPPPEPRNCRRPG